MPTEAEPESTCDDADDGPPARCVSFTLRLFAGTPLPATLRARAEALCLAYRGGADDWHVAIDPAGLEPARDAIRALRPLHPRSRATATRPDVAALVLALPEPADPAARVSLGRPVAGALPACGAVLGRVPRPDGRQVPWRLDWEARRLHTLIAGASGCGKTTAMIRLALDDIEAGRTVVLLDPHGDVADQIAAVAPAERLVRVDPRIRGTAALDLLDPDPGRAASHLLSAASEVWPADFAGPVWQRAMSLACRCLHASTQLSRRATIADVERFFVDSAWRQELIGGVEDRRLAAELRREDDAWRKPARDDASMVNWLSSKLTPLTQGPGRPLFTAPVEVPLEAQVASGAIIVVALPIGTLGLSTTALVARMFLTRLTAAIAAQGARPVAERHPLSVFVDEAHLAAGAALGGLFAQARKFNCSVTVACQSPSQLQPHLEEVLTNAQTHLYGRLSRNEAMHVGARIGEHGVRALPRLPRHHLLVALEDSDPDLAPIVLTPVAPPRLPAPVPPAEPADTADPEEAQEAEPPGAPSFEDLLADLIPLEHRGA